MTVYAGRVDVVGDNLIRSDKLVADCEPFRARGYEIVALDWLAANLTQMQEWNIQIERDGPEAVPTAEGLVEAARQADVVITHYCPVPRRVIQAGSKLKVIAVARGGVENINVEAATEHEIAVVHIVGRHASAVAELTVGLMLAETRHIGRAHAAIQQGRWYRDDLEADECIELNGKTVGLIGFGAVGRVVARRMAGFDVRLIAYDPYVPDEVMRQFNAAPIDLEVLLRESDIVSLHARLWSETRGMIGARELALMKPTAYLINTARAGLVDEAALLEALQTRSIRGAAMDVYSYEPLPADHPLCRLDNVTLTAHQAGSTQNVLENTTRFVAQAAYRCLFEGWMEWTINHKEGFR